MPGKLKRLGNEKWFAVVAISLGAIAFSLDLNVLSLALPTLSRSLHATTSQLQWIVDAYSLALAVMLLPAGLIGDRYGRKKWLLIALSIFGLASLACAYSSTANELIAARVMLGLAGAFILPLGLSVIPVMFTAKERPKAIALLMGGIFLAAPLGPILGGWLLSTFWWGSVFLINVPVIIIALIAITAFLPESKSSTRSKVDFVGVILSALGISGITYGAIQAGSHGWGSSEVLGSIIAGIIFIILLVIWEKRVIRHKHHPLIELKLFSSAGFVWGTILATGVTFVLFGILFAVPQYFQVILGNTPMQSGIRLLSMVAGLIIGSIISSKLGLKIGFKVVTFAGFILMGVGLIMGTTTTLATSPDFTISWLAVLGLGLGLAMPIAVNAAIGALDSESSGVGSALIQAMRQVGGTLGVAVLGTIIASAYKNHLNVTGLPQTLADVARGSVAGGVVVANKIGSINLLENVKLSFVHGMNITLWIGAGIAFVNAILAAIFLPNKSTHAVKEDPVN